MITNNKIKTNDKKTKSVLKKLKSLIWLILPIAIGLGLITTKIYHPEAVGISNDFFTHFDRNHDHEMKVILIMNKLYKKLINI